MRNYPEWVVGYWAITSLGAAVVGMNAWWTTPEMEYGLTDSRPKVLIADDERLERVLPVLDGLRADAPLHVIAVRTERRAAGRRRRAGPTSSCPTTRRPALPAADIDPDDDATIFYTSGTTGLPEGRPADPPRLGAQHLPPRVLGDGRRRSAEAKAIAAGEIPRPGRAAPAPPDQLVFMAPDAAVPRHRVQLPAAPVHAGRRHASC